MSLINFDESAWPVVSVTWGAGEASDDDVASLLARLAKLLERKQRFGVVLDSRQGKGVNAKQRQMFATFQTVNNPLLKQYMPMALVLATAFQRGLLTAVNWLQPPANEQKVFSEPGPAFAWIRERLEVTQPA